MWQYSLQISSKSEIVMREPFSESGDLTRNDPKVSGDILIPAYYRQLFGCCYETSIKSCDKYYEVKFLFFQNLRNMIICALFNFQKV